MSGWFSQRHLCLIYIPVVYPVRATCSSIRIARYRRDSSVEKGPTRQCVINTGIYVKELSLREIQPVRLLGQDPLSDHARVHSDNRTLRKKLLKNEQVFIK